MHFVRCHTISERGIDTLMALDWPHTDEFRRHDGRIPVAAVAIHGKVVALQSRGNDAVDFFSGHVVSFQ